MLFRQSSGADRRYGETILIIENDLNLTGQLRDAVQGLGYKSAEARNGQEGLEQIQHIEPDLVICGQMTGVQLLERLRGAYPQYRSIPFIFLAALSGPEGRAAVCEPFAYLERPFDFRLLKKTIDSALNPQAEERLSC